MTGPLEETVVSAEVAAERVSLLRRGVDVVGKKRVVEFG